MDSKDVYIKNLSKYVSDKYNIDYDDLEKNIRKFMMDNYYMLCKEISDNNIIEEPKKTNTNSIEMYCIEFNGHIYFADKRNRVYTANKENPIEIGYIKDTEESRILIKYNGYENY